ncbi:LysM peptidoglycan-binding domain-containing M23 family metallopeptidase [Methylocapsa acidiphila]|uniref:LysM peptidoglycan-binding domain-containing M23 family metallopeptidase n=1 Tax=Methylocapsa acidiphila TaxID=133552 RepID=UPI001FD9B516|nr:LysM peptidoglycan-binding domain-containing M23 family metallopeptidase [Methylocapsa acidiphila]
MTGAAAGMLAGCSSSERLGDPFSNPFQTSSGGDAASAASPAPAASAPVSPVQSRPLAAPAASAPILAQPTSKLAAAAPSRPAQSASGWSVEGGSPVVVAQGENVEVLARRYGVPAEAIVRANGFASATQVQPGSRVVIPVYNAALAASSGAHVPTSASAATATTAQQGKSRYAEKAKLLKGGVGATKLAAAAPAVPSSPVKVASEPKAATAKIAAAAPSPAPAPIKPTPKLAQSIKTETVVAQPKAAKPEPASVAKAEPAPAEAKKAVVEPVQTASMDTSKSGADAANPEFRWPARGRIIQAFKPGGNDGINIAVPEGTSVKAAESGVVAYAGNELKGYGNLILIRHPNGFVTAYANNGDIEVKRGDTVKRGQTIAKSGQSGNVASPQLHFELRKGATPVDPTQYLAGL